MSHSTMGATEAQRGVRSRRYNGDAVIDDPLAKVLRHWWVVAVCAVLGAAVGLVGTAVLPDTYATEARLRLIVGEADVLGGEASASYESADEATRRMETTAAAVLSDAIVSQVAADLDTTEDDVRDRLRVEAVEGTNVLAVGAEGATAEAAAELAQTTAEAFRVSLESAGAARLTAAADEIEARAASIAAEPSFDPDSSEADYVQTLLGTALDLRTRAALFQGAADLLSAAPTPKEPSSAGPVEGLAYGVGLGSIIGVAMALLLPARRRTRRDGAPSQEPADEPGRGGSGLAGPWTATAVPSRASEG